MKVLLVTAATLMTSASFADVYKIDANASKVEWSGGKKIGGGHNGEIKVKSGEVQTDSAGKVTSAVVVVDMKSISNTDLKDSPDMQKKLVGHLSSDDFFKVDQFPESKFTLKTIAPKKGSATEYVVKGDLTMLGKTQAIEFPATMSSDKNKLSGSAKVTIERLKWGLQYGSGSIFKSLTADKIINDTFDLTLNIVAQK
ncbi:MAG: YceI family protein [Bdellovibrionales bacterium]|nr:YceI family protein [Bdellovibrionales bacterium]